MITPPIRSFVKRQGRITPGQRRAFTQLWPQYRLEPSMPFVQQAVFGRLVTLRLEIGFGMGAHLLSQALALPNQDFIGIDVYEPGVGKLMAELEAQSLTNVRLYCADAVTVLHDCFFHGVFTQIDILFPDPWPKKRHHKRRLIQPDFVNLLVAKLKPEGLLHLATDWADYGEHIQTVLEQNPALIAVDQAEFQQKKRAHTKFERRGLKLGHNITEFYYKLA